MDSSALLLIFSTLLLHIKASARCPEGWHNHGCFCYKLSTDKDNWYAAVRKCEEQNSHLVTIHSKLEEDFLLEIANTDAVYIGFHDQKKDNNFEWIDRSRITYKNWGHTEPNNVVENCGSIFKENGKWIDEPCSNIQQSACKKPAEYEACGNGWSYDNIGQCFYVNEMKLNWESAKRHCHNLNGHLASIKTKEENEFLKSLLPTGATWIGLTYRENEQQWAWENNFQSLNYTNWGETEPNGDEDCAILKTSDRRWHDVSCGWRERYICKKPIKNPSFQELSIKVSDKSAEVYIEWAEDTEVDCPKLQVKSERIPHNLHTKCYSHFEERSNSKPLVQYGEEELSSTVPLTSRLVSNFELGPLEACTAYNVSFIWSQVHILHSVVIVTSDMEKDQYERTRTCKRMEYDDDAAVSMVWWGVVLLSFCLFILGLGIGYISFKPRTHNNWNAFPLGEVSESTKNILDD